MLVVFALTVRFQDSSDGDESENQFAGEVEEEWVGMDEEVTFTNSISSAPN